MMISDPQANDYPHINEFLLCPTPNAWLEQAKLDLELLLLDHAHCELKAASTALKLIFNYPKYQTLCIELSKLAREELLHFEKVMEILLERNIEFKHLSASKYASSLLKHARASEPDKAVDALIIGAIIEARSCERFLALIPLLDDKLAAFYKSLVKSEARHFTTYLDFAKNINQTDISPHVERLLQAEKKLILGSDPCFRFHSGVPA